MGFWVGVAQAVREEDQQRHERELFTQKVNESRMEGWLKTRKEQEASRAKAQAEATAMIRRGATILKDTDVAAALYQSGQLGDIITTHDKGVENKTLNQAGFELIAQTVREQAGDDIQGFGASLLQSISSGGDLTTEEGLADAILEINTGGKTIEEIERELPMPSFDDPRGTAPAFDIDPNRGFDSKPGELVRLESDYSVGVKDLLGDKLLFSYNPDNTVNVTRLDENDPSGRAAADLYSNGFQKYIELTQEAGMPAYKASKLIRSYMNSGLDPRNPASYQDLATGIESIMPDDVFTVDYGNVPAPQPTRVDTAEDAQEYLGDGPTSVVPPTPPRPSMPVQGTPPGPVTPITPEDILEDTNQSLDNRETSSWSRNLGRMYGE